VTLDMGGTGGQEGAWALRAGSVLSSSDDGTWASPTRAPTWVLPM
jgi:hypothetical protein